MTFSLERFCEPMLLPIGFLWSLLVLGTGWSLWKRRWRSGLLPGMLAAFLSVAGSTAIPARLLASLERPYAHVDLTKVPVCDAVVMLGGTHNYSPSDAFKLDLAQAADRIIMSLELMRQQKGKTLVLGGGGREIDGKQHPDAQLLQDWFAAWGLPTAPVSNLGICRNTRDEAERVQALVKERGWQRVIVVTSGYHMKRAEAIFRKLGVSIVPVACDFQGLAELELHRPFTPFPLIQKVELLNLYLHETIGWLVYRWRGWVGDDPAPN